MIRESLHGKGMRRQALGHRSISVVITSYNQKAFLVEAIESALNQTLRPYEIIIVDDCSTDGSAELIGDYAGRYPDVIKAVFQESNVGVAKNRSCGFQEASGDLVTWANGDDRLLPRKLELELEAYDKDPEARWAYSQVFYVDACGHRTGTFRYRGKFRNKAYTFRDVAVSFGREPAYQLIDRSILEEVGLFDAKLDIYEDWDFVLRLAKHSRPAYCPEPLYEYRQYEGGLSSADSKTHLAALKRVHENLLPLLEGLADEDNRAIRRRFAAEISGFEALERLRTGRRPEAGRYLVRAITKNPWDIFYYEIAAMLLFPAIIIDGLRAVKSRYLAGLR